MRVVLEVTNGPKKGNRFLLIQGQRLRIGRTQVSEKAFPDDDRLSSRHFEVWTDDAGCFIRDLKSTNGTKVNDELIVERALSKGDVIVAGRTHFLVQVEGVEEGAANKSAGRISAHIDEAAMARALRGKLHIDCTVEDTEAGWKLFRGEVKGIEPATLAQLVSGMRKYKLWLSVDFRRLGQPLPDGIQPIYLIDWLPVEVAEAMSPVLIDTDSLEHDVWEPWINAGWGADCVVALFTDLPEDKFLAHLRSIARVKGHAADGSADAVAGIYWPSILAPALMSSTSDMVKNLMSGLKCALVELPDLPDSWQLFGKESLVKTLTGFGFRIFDPKSETVT